MEATKPIIHGGVFVVAINMVFGMLYAFLAVLFLRRHQENNKSIPCGFQEMTEYQRCTLVMLYEMKQQENMWSTVISFILTIALHICVLFVR